MAVKEHGLNTKVNHHYERSPLGWFAHIMKMNDQVTRQIYERIINLLEGRQKLRKL